MSKDFEAEYREYQKQSVPDLWSRIEAGIDAEEAEKKSETQKVIKFPVWKTATIVAACFAVIICIPSLGIVMLGFGGSKSENTTAMDTSVDMDMVVTESAAEYEEEPMANCVADSAESTPITEMEVSITKVEITDEIRYTAVRLDTEEEIAIIQRSDAPYMEEGYDYTILVTKTEEDIYYFETLVVE